MSPQTPEPGDAFLADRRAEDAALAEDVARSSRGPRLQWPLMLVLGGLLVSLAVVASDHFRRGAVLFAEYLDLRFGDDFILDTFADRPHVFNLGHGIGQFTPIENVERLLAVVRGWSR